ncbi:MAG: hypothetical protein J7M29_03665 [Verrucomicrobia bacterium]|nr:hypothetical protein [Verrucomicrobiota bacterium]
MTSPDALAAARIWVCFAVRAEARPLLAWAARRPGISILLTGIGPERAARTLRSRLAAARPRLVVSAGFAGGLNPDLPLGATLASGPPELIEPFRAAGAREGKFASSPRVATTPEEKAALRKQTGADAVEMESTAILRECAAAGAPALVVRVISDPANRLLPLDFNRAVDGQGRPRPLFFAKKLLRRPGTAIDLLRFSREARFAARRLAEVLRAGLSKLTEASSV